MKNIKSKFSAALLALVLIPTMAYAAVTIGDVQRLDLDQITLDGTVVTATGAELNILDGVTATAAEINMAADISSVVEDVTATNILTSAECGKAMTLNSSTEFVTTLPAATAGCSFRFYVKAAPSGASYTIVTDSSANVLLGQVVTSDVNSATDSDFEASGADTITLVDSKAVKGDSAECESDGTNWYCTIRTSVFDGATFTTAS
jgi:hypothetical protein